MLAWSFEAGAPLHFSVHYYLRKEAVFPSKPTAVSHGEGHTLTTKIDQDSCWMRSNKSAAPATLTIELQRQ